MIPSFDGGNLAPILLAKPLQRKPGAEFCTFAGLLTIRSWQPRDRTATEELVKAALEEHGLNFDPLDTDRDLVYPEKYYDPAGGELWVLEKDNCVVGCAALLPTPGTGVVEFRKMYFSPSIRGKGYGKLILEALEFRASELGYREARLETSHLLEAACKLYESMGFIRCAQVHTPRCSRAYKKELTFQRSSNDHSESNTKDYVYWLDTQGRLFCLLKEETAVRHAVFYKQWRLSIRTKSKISLFPSQGRQKIYQCFLWSTENQQLISWLQHLSGLYSGEIKVAKCLHIVLPSTQQNVIVQLLSFDIDDSNSPMSNFIDRKDIEKYEIDRDDYYILKEEEK